MEGVRNAGYAHKVVQQKSGPLQKLLKTKR